MKNDWENVFSKNRETIWNRAKEFLENNKEVLKAKAKNKYRKLSEEEKNKKFIQEIDTGVSLTKTGKS